MIIATATSCYNIQNCNQKNILLLYNRYYNHLHIPIQCNSYYIPTGILQHNLCQDNNAWHNLGLQYNHRKETILYLVQDLVLKFHFSYDPDSYPLPYCDIMIEHPAEQPSEQFVFVHPETQPETHSEAVQPAEQPG